MGRWGSGEEVRRPVTHRTAVEKTRAWGQILTGSPLGPCSPLKPAIPGSPLKREAGPHTRFSPGSLPTPEPLFTMPSDGGRCEARAGERGKEG